jgi:hypothetical protein
MFVYTYTTGMCIYIYMYTGVYTYTGVYLCASREETRKSSFQGSLYLSRESLGNHFFEEVQKSTSIYMRHGEFQGGHPLVCMPVFVVDFGISSIWPPACSRRLKIG